MSTTIKQKPVVPELRFSGFDGEWNKEKLGQVAEFWNGKAHEQEINADGKYVVVNSKFVSTEGRIRKFSNQLTSELRTGDIALVMSDIPNGKAIGKCYLIKENKRYTLNQRIGGIRSENIISPFLHSILNRNKYFLAFDNGVSQTNLRKDEVLSCPLIYPELDEQQKIADFLGSIDAWLDNLRSQKTALQSYKQGMMQKLFTGQVRFKDEAGKSFPDWEEKELGELLSYKQPTEFIVESTEYKDEYKTPVLTAGKTFILGYTDETKGVYDYELPVIIFDDFTTATKFVDFKFKVKSSAMKILVPLDGHNAQFLFEAIQQIQFEVGGHGRQWISKYSRIPVSTPSAEEQSKIGDFILSVDKLVAAKEKEVAKVEEWKKGLMQKMFV